jgi:hypothetical protein
MSEYLNPKGQVLHFLYTHSIASTEYLTQDLPGILNLEQKVVTDILAEFQQNGFLEIDKNPSHITEIGDGLRVHHNPTYTRFTDTGRREFEKIKNL